MRGSLPTSLSRSNRAVARHTSDERGLPGVLKVVGDHTDKSDGQRYRRVHDRSTMRAKSALGRLEIPGVASLDRVVAGQQLPERLGAARRIAGVSVASRRRRRRQLERSDHPPAVQTCSVCATSAT